MAHQKYQGVTAHAVAPFSFGSDWGTMTWVASVAVIMAHSVYVLYV